MYRTHNTRGLSRNLLGVAGILLVAACSSSAPESAGENTGNVPASLLSAACTVTSGNLAIVVNANEVGYVGKVNGCTTEPCLFTNALDSAGQICRINSTGKTIAVTSGGAGTEKMVIDYSNGLFALAATTPLVTVALPSGTSKLMVIPPVGGGNMALGVSGLDANALAARGTPLVDVTVSAGVDIDFNGGAGNDVFTGDPGGWTTPPTGWATAANLTTALGAATTLTLTVSGGAGDDKLAGGAGTNSLLGGAGNDTFYQSATARAETMNGGDGIDTVDYSLRTNPVRVSPGINSAVGTVTAAVIAAGTGYTVGDTLTLVGGKLGPATVTVATITGGGATGPVGTVSVPVLKGSGYSTGTKTTTGGTGNGACTVAVTALVADDGEIGEGDAVGGTIEIIKGGSGDDILNAYAITLTEVVLMGQAGNDKLTGGSLDDDLCGGTGDDTFYTNPGDNNLVGGAGLDTADYSTGTSVIACLNVTDQAATKPCATQNGSSGQKDLVNGVLTKVCPRATLTVDVGGVPTAAVAVPTTMQGGAMAVDVENLTGHPTAANSLYCGTLACTLFGGSGIDTLYGGAAGDIIIGGGNADIVKTNGGNDLVDLTNSGGGVTVTVDCGGSQSTLLISAADTLAPTACTNANTP